MSWASKKISALSAFGDVVGIAHREPADYNQTVSKKYECEIGDFYFFAQRRWSPFVVGISGILLLCVGMLLLLRNNGFYFLGVALTLGGVYIAIYGPSTWLLLGAR